VNGDGRLDLGVVNQSSATVSVLLGNGSGGFGPKTDYAPATFRTVAIADVTRTARRISR